MVFTPAPKIRTLHVIGSALLLSLLQLGLSTTWQETTIQEDWFTWSHTKNTGKALIPYRDIIPILCRSSSPTKIPELPPCSSTEPAHFSEFTASRAPELPSQSLRLPPLLFSHPFSYCPLSELWLLINGVAFSLPPMHLPPLVSCQDLQPADLTVFPWNSNKIALELE